MIDRNRSIDFLFKSNGSFLLYFKEKTSIESWKYDRKERNFIQVWLLIKRKRKRIKKLIRVKITKDHSRLNIL